MTQFWFCTFIWYFLLKIFKNFEFKMWLSSVNNIYIYFLVQLNLYMNDFMCLGHMDKRNLIKCDCLESSQHCGTGYLVLYFVQL